ncbi:MAG: hypothetical protein ACRDU4_10145 [Mycobacterium sp.]
MVGSIALAVAIVGCGSGTPTGSSSPGATLAPGATATLAPISTPAGSTAAPTGGTATTGHECDAMPTFSLSNPDPSFEPDAALLAKFPTTVDGQPVTDVTAVPFIDYLCIGGQAAFDQAAAGYSSGGVNLAAMSFGGFTANVDGEDVDVTAFRQPGGDANALAQTIAALGLAAGNPVAVGQITTTSVAGKSVYTWTDTDGSKGYAYVSGDTMIVVDSATDSQATKIISALP